MRKSLAEQVQSRKLSLLERNLQITKFHSKMLAEERAGCWRTPQPIRRSPLRRRSGACQIPMAAQRWAETRQTVTDRDVARPPLECAATKETAMVLSICFSFHCGLFLQANVPICSRSAFPQFVDAPGEKHRCGHTDRNDCVGRNREFYPERLQRRDHEGVDQVSAYEASPR